MASRDPKLLTPLLQEFWPRLCAAYIKKFPGRALFLTCTYRSVEEQKALYAQNKPHSIITRCDGVTNLSNHNHSPARAFDVAASEKGVVHWEESFYLPLAPMIKELGYGGRIRWGGWFSSFKGDVYHFEEM